MLRLALADAWHDKRIFFCYAFAMAAVLGPLLILYGLKFGIVQSLSQELLDDPRNREILIIGNRRYEAAWLEELAGRGEVAFLVPRTRSIAASIYVASEKRRSWELVTLVPSGAGDPLLDAAKPVPSGTRVAVSPALAKLLSLAPGETFQARVTRTVDQRREEVTFPLEVEQVLRPAATQRKAVFVPLTLLEAVEDYRDGYGVPDHGWTGAPPRPGPRTYASFRIYGAGLDDVGPLVDWLSGQGVEVRSRRAEIESLQNLERNLNLIFTIVASLGGAGFLISLAAILWSNVDRKTHYFSIIRLLGVTSRRMVLFPVFQSWGIALGGFLISLVFFQIAAWSTAGFLKDATRADQVICVLLPSHLAIAFLSVMAIASAASLLPAWQAGKIDPSEGLRSA
jgi:putative ABC transport system permease protein